MKKNFIKILCVATLIVVFSSQIAHAQVPEALSYAAKTAIQAGSDYQNNGGNFFTDIARWIGNYLLYAIGYIAGALFTLGAWLINFTIGLNVKILDSPIVQVGWLIARDITNLGLVLAIIIMAFATMFRMQSYGMKQTLWKLVVIAVLINFSLTMVGVLIDFSHVLTTYFVTKSSPLGSAGGFGNFSASLATALNPQLLLKTPSNAGVLATGAAVGSNAFLFMGQLFFVTLFTILGAITFLGIAMMLLIRYVMLGLLLVVMPVAWLTWVIPSYSGYLGEWWKELLKWIFFAPIVTFFMYLAIYASTTLGDAYAKMTKDIKPDPALESVVGQLTGGAAALGNMVITLGLMMGGLYMANRMGIEGSKTFYGMAIGAGKGMSGWAGRKGRALTTGQFKGTLGQGVAAGLQKIGAGRGAVLGTLTRPIRSVGVALQQAGAGRAKSLAEEGKSRTKDLTPQQMGNLYRNSSYDDQAGMLLNAIDKGSKGDAKSMEFVSDHINEQTKSLMSRYGLNRDFAKMEKMAGYNLAMVSGKDEQGEAVPLEEATKKFHTPFTQEDWQKINPQSLMHQRFGSLLRKDLLENNPAAMGKILPKLSGDALSKTIEALKTTENDIIYNAVEEVAGKNFPITDTNTMLQTLKNKGHKDTNKLAKMHRSFERGLDKRFYEESPREEREGVETKPPEKKT